jgi:peptide/nickel transport system permease protein
VRSAFLRYTVRRAALAVALVLVASSAAFLLAWAAPGDVAGGIGIDPAAAAAERHRLGLDRPVLEQYVTWISRAARFDLGESLRYRRPVARLVRDRAANTALLGLTALLLATLIGIPLGVLTGARRGGIVIAAAKGLSLVLVSIPSLITSLALLLFAASTGLFPVGGLDSSAGAATVARHLVLPTLALALPLAASLERLQSRALADALADPCIYAALARGLSKRRVIWRHGLRLAARPVLAVYGIMFGSVLSGSFAVEVVMAWPGLGELLYRAVQSHDVNLIAGCAVAASTFLAAGVLLSDLALAAVDPRVEAPA